MKFFYKIVYFIMTIYLLFAIYCNVSAANLQTKLNIIQKSSETKQLENNQGYLSKKITNSNPDTGEVTIELKLENSKHDTQVETTAATEIMLVIDNSPSMDFVTTDGRTRKEIVISSAKTLVNSIFNSVSNIKIGLVDFHGQNGWFEDASISNATLRLSLTNKKEDILSALENQLNRSTVGGTNIDAGLQRAEKNFSKNCKNKIIVLLTDGVPNADVSGNNSNDVTTEGNLIIQKSTKSTLQRLEKEGFHIISMMTGMSESDGNTDKNGNVYEDGELEDNLKAVENIFGTMQNPTAGKYYLVASADIETIINDNILNDVVEQVQNPINTIKIVDYFPEEIAENFEISYIEEPNIGTVSEYIDLETNSITWDIETLKGEEIATLKYKLKIKNMQSTELLNKIISTNEKVVLTYIDSNSEDYIVTLTSSPRIELVEIKEIEEPKDNTTAPGRIPQTGFKTILEISVIIIGCICIIAYFKYKKLKDIN